MIGRGHTKRIRQRFVIRAPQRVYTRFHPRVNMPLDPALIFFRVRFERHTRGMVFARRRSEDRIFAQSLRPTHTPHERLARRTSPETRRDARDGFEERTRTEYSRATTVYSVTTVLLGPRNSRVAAPAHGRVRPRARGLGSLIVRRIV